MQCADLQLEKTEYDFVDERCVGIFKDETLHLQSMINFAIDEMYRFRIKHRTFHNFSSFSEILILNLNEYIETIRSLRLKVCNTIYKDYKDEISNIYYENVWQPLSQLADVAFGIKEQCLRPMMAGEAKHKALQRIIGHEIGCGWRRVTIEELRQGAFRRAREKESGCLNLSMSWKIIVLPDEWIDNMPNDSAKISVLETIMSVLTQTAVAVRKIHESMSALRGAPVNRPSSDEAIIYSFLKRQFEEERKKDILAKFSEQQDRYRKDRQQQLNSQYLTRLLDETEQEYSQHTLCRMWHEWGCAASIEDFAHACVKEQLPKEDFNLLFEYQAKCEMIKGMIADVRSSEQGRDPLFATWVDPIKLEGYLQAWIEAKVTTQEKWYVVWCLMKYTFGIIKPDAYKNDFAERMGFMFPDAPKKCVVESFRKQAPKMNHNCHFSEWLKTDLDYAMAKDLYMKLKKKEWYKREETDL